MKWMYVHPSVFPEENCPDLAVAVLAGGASRRFGSDKALVRLCPGGPTVLERVVESGRNVASDVFVVGHERYESLLPGILVVPDELPGEGPLGGILSALRHTQADRVLVLACDTPCLSIPLLQWLASFETEAEILVPRTDDGRLHPMPAIYRRSILPAVEASLRSANRSVISLFDRVDVQSACEADLRRYDPELSSLFSLNQPQHLERAKACVSCN
jgi:molybdopterin-guanine dinucleotide biosynthesis protein A